MSQNIANYVVGLNFTKALQGIKKLKKEFKSLNDMQVSMNKIRPSSRGFPSSKGNTSNLASETKLAQQMRSEERKHQEAVGAVMNRQINKKLRAEKQRIASLEKAKKVIMESEFMQDKGLSTEKAKVRANIQKRIQTAKTADQVRRIVREEKTSVRLMQKKNFLMRRMEASSKNYAGNMISAFAIAATGTAITRTGQDFEAVGNTMLAVSKNSEEAGDNLKYAKDEAYRLGLGLKDSSKGFAKLLAARGDMSLDDTKKLFTGVSEMGTLLGLSAEEGGRAIMAIQQMASKGVVSAEELKLQLGEVLPNAIQLMAEAAKDAGLTINGTVAEMMKLQQEGGLISSKVLPHFAKRMHEAATANGALEKALKSNRVAMNQMITGMQMAADTIFKSGWSEGLTDLFKSIGDLFRENEHTFIAFGNIMGKVFKGLAWIINNVITPAFSAFGSILNVVSDLLDLLGGWASLLLIPLAKISPLLKLIKFGVGGITVAMAPLIATTAAWTSGLFLALGVLEEIAEFFSPTGKKTLLGVNINDVNGTNEEATNKNKGFWENTFKNMNRGDQWAQDKYGVPSNRVSPSYGSFGQPKTTPQPIILNSTVAIDGEAVGTASMKSHAVQSGIDSKIAESNSNNFN